MNYDVVLREAREWAEKYWTAQAEADRLRQAAQALIDDLMPDVVDPFDESDRAVRVVSRSSPTVKALRAVLAETKP
jgi:hypothetical protein